MTKQTLITAITLALSFNAMADDAVECTGTLMGTERAIVANHCVTDEYGYIAEEVDFTHEGETYKAEAIKTNADATIYKLEFAPEVEKVATVKADADNLAFILENVQQWHYASIARTTSGSVTVTMQSLHAEIAEFNITDTDGYLMSGSCMNGQTYSPLETCELTLTSSTEYDWFAALEFDNGQVLQLNDAPVIGFRSPRPSVAPIIPLVALVDSEVIEAEVEVIEAPVVTAPVVIEAPVFTAPVVDVPVSTPATTPAAKPASHGGNGGGSAGLLVIAALGLLAAARRKA